MDNGCFTLFQHKYDSSADVLRVYPVKRLNIKSKIGGPCKFGVYNVRVNCADFYTIVISDRSFPIDVVRHVKAMKDSYIGGERHSIILFDILNSKIVSKKLELSHSDGIEIVFKHVNPNNRAVLTVHEIFKNSSLKS